VIDRHSDRKRFGRESLDLRPKHNIVAVDRIHLVGAYDLAIQRWFIDASVQRLAQRVGKTRAHSAYRAARSGHFECMAALAAQRRKPGPSKNHDWSKR
jgi:hypothetical protein